MKLEIYRLRAQADSLDGEDVNYFKRVTADLSFHSDNEDDPPDQFEAIVDCRAGLLLVRPRDGKMRKSPNTPMAVGEALIAAASKFSHDHIWNFVRPSLAAPTGKKAEWTVSDPDRLAGLFHRVKEEKQVDFSSVIAHPLALVEIRTRLLEELQKAINSVLLAFESGDSNLDYARYHEAPVSAWRAYQTEFLRANADHHEKLVIARLYDRIEVFGRVHRDVMQTEQGDYGAPVPTHLKNTRGSAMRLLRSIRSQVVNDAQALGLSSSYPGNN